MSWFLLAIKKYANFTGRSQRSEYWYFVLFYLLIFVALCLVDWLVGTFSPSNEIGLLSGIFSLAMIVPSIAVAARRLHDTDRSQYCSFRWKSRPMDLLETRAVSARPVAWACLAAH